MLVADEEQGAEIYSAATDRQQAGIVHGEGINMVEASPELSDALYINRSTKTIFYNETRSLWRALSATPKSNEGWNAHCIIADELHKWHGRELYDALRWAFAAGRSRFSSRLRRPAMTRNLSAASSTTTRRES